MSERESMAYDVVIVGAGPAGLTAAIRLKQLAGEAGRELLEFRAIGRELGAIRQMPVDEQMRHFLELAIRRQIVNVVAVVRKNAAVSIQVTNG